LPAQAMSFALADAKTRGFVRRYARGPVAAPPASASQSLDPQETAEFANAYYQNLKDQVLAESQDEETAEFANVYNPNWKGQILTKSQDEEDGVEAREEDPVSGHVCTKSQSPGRRVVSVADLHGDFDAMVSLLQTLNIVGMHAGRQKASWKGAWVGGNAVLVQLGDIVDRGADGRIMYRFLWALQDQAGGAGGRVVLLVGNHELFLLRGLTMDRGGDADACMYTRAYKRCLKRPGDHYQCKGVPDTKDSAEGCLKRAWAVGGDMGGQLRRRVAEGKMNMVLKLGDLVFVHAGLVPELWKLLGHSHAVGLEWLSDLVNKTDFALDSGVLAMDDHPHGPAWTRMGMGHSAWESQRERVMERYPWTAAEKENIPVVQGRCSAVQQALLKAQGTRMIIGHNPNYEGDAVIKCGGRLLLTDTYMSIGYTKHRTVSTRNLLALETADAPGAEIMQVYAGRTGGDRCRPVGPIVQLEN